MSSAHHNCGASAVEALSSTRCGAEPACRVRQISQSAAANVVNICCQKLLGVLDFRRVGLAWPQ